MPCTAADLVDGDCLLGAVDFLDFLELSAYLASSRRLSLHSTAAWDDRSWRMQSLEARIPQHVKWRPSADPELKTRSLVACATWRLARGLQLYEQKRFGTAEDELRALLILLPGRPFAMCRLADTLYGRAISLKADAAASPSSRSSSPASAGEPWVDGRVVNQEQEGEEDGEDGDGEDGDGEVPVPYSRSPLSPAPPRLTEAPSVPFGASAASLSVSESSVAAPEPLRAERWQDAEVEDETFVQPLAERTSSAASSRQAQTPPPWNTWTPPLEVDEGPETQETAGDEDTLRARASSFEEDDPPPAEPRHSDIEEAPESTSKIEAMRERLLSEAKDLYEQAFRDSPDCSYAVNGLTLFVTQRSLKIELLERAIELDDENPYALANLGGELFGVDDVRALELLEKALQINPRLFYARLVKSKVLLRLGDLPGAVEAARSQLEWQPHDEIAVRFLSQLEFRLEVVRRRIPMV